MKVKRGKGIHMYLQMDCLSLGYFLRLSRRAWMVERRAGMVVI